MPSGRLAGAELNPLLASPFVRGRCVWVAPSFASPLPRGRLVGSPPRKAILPHAFLTSCVAACGVRKAPGGRASRDA